LEQTHLLMGMTFGLSFAINQVENGRLTTGTGMKPSKETSQEKTLIGSFLLPLSGTVYILTIP